MNGTIITLGIGMRIAILLILISGTTHGIDVEMCADPLGMENGLIPDHRISASSYFSAAVYAIYGRVRVEKGGGAWCPQQMVYHEESEYLQVDLGDPHVLTKLEVQGRFGNGHGVEFTPHYKLQYWREGFKSWITYHDGYGKELLEGNTNTYLSTVVSLSPPLIASKVRFVPFSDQPRTVCLRVEIYGCKYLDGITSYSVPPSNDVNIALSDVTYDGTTSLDMGGSGGLGQLTDGELGYENYHINIYKNNSGYEWVGWKRNIEIGQKYIDLNFEFDSIRNFSEVSLYANNYFTKDVMIFSKLEVYFVSKNADNTSTPTLVKTHKPKPDRIFEHCRYVSLTLRGSSKEVMIRLYFSLDWILLSEVTFQSVPCNCEDWLPPSLSSSSSLPPPIEVVNSDVQVLTVPSATHPDTKFETIILGGLISLGVLGVLMMFVSSIYCYKIKQNKEKSASNTCSVENNQPYYVGTIGRQSNNAPNFIHTVSKDCSDSFYIRENTNIYQEPFPTNANNAATQGYHQSMMSLNNHNNLEEMQEYSVPNLHKSESNYSRFYDTPPPPLPPMGPPKFLPTKHFTSDTKLNLAHSHSFTRTFPPKVLCHPSYIQSATGSVIYSSLNKHALIPKVPVMEVSEEDIRIIETIGEGLFGQIQLCEVTGGMLERRKLFALKSLCEDAGEPAQEDFEVECDILKQMDNPNIIKMIGIVKRDLRPHAMILEYMDFGDLSQFLRRYIRINNIFIISPADSNQVMFSTPPTLPSGALIHICSQIASGMKYLESLSFVHRDLAARNCLVGQNLVVKISDFGMSRPLYTNDYYRLEGRALLPIRWMAWESILHGKFTSKTDVWAFGVTMWEIMNLCKLQPFEELTDEQLLINISTCYGLGTTKPRAYLPQPEMCSSDVYDIMKMCWDVGYENRPSFYELFILLQRKNLSFALDCREQPYI